MGTELATQQQSFTLADIEIMAQKAAASRLFPGASSEDSAFTLMMLCQADGLHPIDAVRRYHVIEGKPSMRADAMQAEFQRNGGLVRWLRWDREACSAVFKHPVHAPGDGITITLTMQDAIDSKLAMTWDKDKREWNMKAMYKKVPAQMLRARVISEGVRMILPGVIVGIYTPEEIDTQDIIDVTPKPQAVIHQPAKPIELTNRNAVNEAFKPAAQIETTPADNRPMAENMEKTPLPGDKPNAKGFDRRKWTQIITDEVSLVRASIEKIRTDLGLEPEIKETINIHSVANHMVKAAIAAGYPDPFTYDENGKKKKTGPGFGGAFLEEVYGNSSDWREWCRAELESYLDTKSGEAQQIAENQAHGDVPSNAENESQLVTAPAGDPADWDPNRE